MLLFAAPLVLLAAAPVAVVGVFALWRGRQRKLVPSTLLWRSVHVADASSTRARRIDPAWLLLTLAALAAVLALAGPVWVQLAPAPAPTFTHLAFRTLPGQPDGELFVQTPAPIPLRLSAGTATFDLPGPQLIQGLTRRLAAGSSLRLTFLTSNGGRAGYTFTPPVQAAFVVTTIGPVAPALERVFAIQPGAHAADAVTPADVALIAGDAAAPADARLVIRTPGADAPLQSVAAAVATGEDADPLLASVDLSAVQVSALTPLTLSASWRVLARVGQQPWLAARSAAGHTEIALASPLVPAVTNWPLDPSFVVFFANALSAADLGSASPQTWKLQSGSVPGAAAAAAGRPPVPLTPAVTGAALLGAALGGWLLTRRG